MKYILAVIDATSKYSGRLVAFLSIPLIAVIMMGVVARYIFHSPFIWTHEMMTFLSAFIFALGGAYVLYYRDHVSVDLLHKRLSTRGRAVMDIVASAFFFIYIISLSRVGINFGLRSLEILETSGTPWNPPVYPVKIGIALAFFLILLAGIANLIRDFKTAVTGEVETQELENDTSEVGMK